MTNREVTLTAEQEEILDIIKRAWANGHRVEITIKAQPVLTGDGLPIAADAASDDDSWYDEESPAEGG